MWAEVLQKFQEESATEQTGKMERVLGGAVGPRPAIIHLHLIISAVSLY
jgi:hypothetical protein